MKSLVVLVFIIYVRSLKTTTERPIIGMLAVPAVEEFPDLKTSYTEVIEGKHAHFVEGGGGRVFPISFKWSKEQMKAALSKVNGVFLPDSRAEFFRNENTNQLSPYAEAAQTLIELAKELNNNGTHFPVWGASRGFELMMLVESKNVTALERCGNCKDYNSALIYDSATKSNLFENMAESHKQYLESQKLAYYDHEYVITLRAFKENPILANNYKATAYTKHPQTGETLVTSVENIRYPFYAVHYNPGSWQYEWDKQRKIAKTVETMLLGHEFSVFFIKECKKNGHSFPGGYAEELKNIIESHYHIFHPTYGYLYLLN